MKQKSGFAFVLALFILLFISLLFIAMFNLLTTEWLITSNQKIDTEALYIAEAGIEDAVLNLRANNSWTGPITQTFPAGSGSNYSVSYAAGVITSTGTLAGGYSKTIDATITIAGIEPYYTVDITAWEER